MKFVKTALGRRTFLKALGVAPALMSSASGAALKAAGLGEGAAAAFGESRVAGVEVGNLPTGLPDTPGSNLSWAAKAVRFFANGNKLPDFVIERIYDDTRAVYMLDVDLASNRSFSLSAKMRMQRDRQFARQMELAKTRANRENAREKFGEKHGLNFW